ncbi:hypothetical protein BH23PLA1_BH23PLA1_30690 [soil metagenome]
MDGRSFLEVARELASGATEAHWRATAGRAYYALLLEARDLLDRWGLPRASRDRAHHLARLRLIYSGDTDLRQAGYVCEQLGLLRNRADYDLSAHRDFQSAAQAIRAAAQAEAAIRQLDQIDADPARRAAAIASIPSLP